MSSTRDILDDFSDYSEEELNFIFSNLNTNHSPRSPNENQKEAILAAFETAKQECLQGSKPSNTNKSIKNAFDFNQQWSVHTDSLTKPFMPPNAIDESLDSSVSGKKHRFRSFFHKGNSHSTFFKNTADQKPLQSIMPMNIDYSQRDIPQPKSYQLDEDKYFDYELRLIAADNDHEAREVVKDMLTKEGSLWIQNSNSNSINAFTNRFLCSLRHNTIEGYKQIIEEKYLQNVGTGLSKNYKFQVGEIDLFRGDGRPSRHIFKNGFDLWPDANMETITKIRYLNSGKVGISTSNSMNVSQGYGGGKVFKIHLPENHRLLSIPLIPGLKNAPQEINFLDNIPPQYIRSVVSKNGKEKVNPNYSPDVILSPKIRRGCY